MKKNVKNLCFAAMCLALAIVLPFITGQIRQIGNMFCPMHLPVMLCGLVCGSPWGFAVGLVAPVLRSLLFGMPPMIPGAVSMMFELAAYGFFSGLFRRLLPDKPGYLYVSLLISMLLGRLVWGAARFVMMKALGVEFSLSLFLSGAVLTAWPGILLQLILLPPLAAALRKAGFSSKNNT